MHQILGVHSIPYSKVRVTVSPFRSGYIRHPYSKKKIEKKYIFTAGCEHFATSREIDKEVVDGLCHGEEVGNKYFKAFLLKH